MIDDGANPLAEVALALAMAFFSLMVLTLFAVVHQPQSTKVESLAITKPAAQAPAETPKLVILHAKGLFDDMLRPISGADLPSGQPITLAVQADVTMAEMMRFQQTHPELDLQIGELTPEWADLLKSRLGE